MQKKLLAVAVAGALGAPAIAMAQTSTVQIFGTLYIEYAYASQGRGGAALSPTGNLANRQNIDILQNPGSELGFKGEEKLGGGLSAWFQCLTTMDFRTGGSSAGATADGVLCSRNSGLGMKGGFGNAWIGRWDMPFKRAMNPTNVGANDTGMFGSAFLRTGGSTSTLDNTSRATFQRRQGNGIFYDTPNFGGFQFMAGFNSANGGGSGTGTVSTTGVTSSKPRVLSLGAQWSSGPIYVGAGYEQHNQFSAAGGELDDSGWHAGMSYRFGPVLVGGHYTRQKFENTGATVAGGPTNATYPAWHIGVDWNIAGPHGMRAAFTRANDARGNAFLAQATPATPFTNTLFAGTYRPAPCSGPTVATASCNNTGADLMQIRYVYTFSKRTEFNAGYVHLKNDSHAAYSLGGLSAPQTGEKQHAFVASLRHTF